MPSGTYTKTNTTITDSNVNSGTAVVMNVTDISLDLDVHSNTEAVGKSTFTGDFDSNLNEGSYQGFSNPSFTIQGKFYTAESDANRVDLDVLKGLANSSATKTLSDDLFGTVSFLIKKITVRKNTTENGMNDYTMRIIQVA